MISAADMQAIPWALFITAVAAPIATAIVAAWIKRGDKAHEWARQDEVARKAAEAARLLVQSNERVARVAREAAGKTDQKLNEIHDLTNSAMTAAKQLRLDGLIENLELREVMEAERAAEGKPPLPENVRAIQRRKVLIEELRAEIERRHEQDRDAQKKARALAAAASTVINDGTPATEEAVAAVVAATVETKHKAEAAVDAAAGLVGDADKAADE